MRHFLQILLLSTLLFSQELVLDDMLQEYQESESLYKETKKESAGFLLIYSREDLERMQAFTLLDVLKSVRLYTLQVHPMGVPRLLQAGQGKSSLPPLKLYIDNFEIATVVQGNALDMYGEMNLYFIDHIEIYQGGSSIAFGNTPGSMVIRLYSKNPSRENSRSFEMSLDNKSGGGVRAIDAGVHNDYEYLLYANANRTNYEKYERNTEELSRDSKMYQAHFKFAQKENFEIVLDAVSGRSDIFNGIGTAPLGDGSQRDYGYLNLTKIFENSVKASLSASIEKKKFLNRDAIGITPQKIPYLDVDTLSNTYKFTLDKKIVKNNHDFLIGVEVQRNSFKLKKHEGSPASPTIGPERLDIYMLYAEELYNVDQNNLLALSAKLDYYKNNFSKSSFEHAFRLGYISLMSENYSTKLFAIQRYTYPKMLQTTFAPIVYQPNPDLDSSNTNMLSGEIEYHDNSNKLTFGYAYKEIEDGLSFSKTEQMYINSAKTTYFNRIYLRGEHKFDLDNKLVVEYYKGYKDAYYSPASGGLVQLFNSYKSFSIYNELIYREGYSVDYGAGEIDIKNGYDYTVAIAYNLNKNITLKLKGENLLDKAIQTPIDPQGNILVSPFERRAILTMEYTLK